MKQLRIIGVVCLLALCGGTWSNLRAEIVLYGDATAIPPISNQDLVVIGGDLDLKYTFSVYGDLHVIGGFIRLQSDDASTTTVDLYVHGDLIVDNYENLEGAPPPYDATITIGTGKLVVTGEVFTRAPNGKASIHGRYGVKAGQIHATGCTEAMLESLGGRDLDPAVEQDGFIDVVGDIFLKSEGDASIHSSDFVRAAFISIDGRGLVRCPETGGGPSGGDTAHIEADGYIDVAGTIFTKSEYGSGYVWAAIERDGYIKADNIFTHGGTDASVHAGFDEYNGFINVKNDIVTSSSTDNAYVAAYGYVKATNITTSGMLVADIRATTSIDAQGNLKTYSALSTGRIFIDSEGGKTIRAKSITTSAANDAYVLAAEKIDVMEEIQTYCFGETILLNGPGLDAYVKSGVVGDIKAGSIQTRSYGGSAKVETNSGTINVDGTINTHSDLGAGDVHVENGDIFAENIYTYALGSAKVLIEVATSDIVVKDVIGTKSIEGNASIEAPGDICARAIRTDGYTDGSIASGAGSILVREDIATKSATGPAYVYAPDGDIKAQRIRTDAAVGEESGYDKIGAAPGSAKFQLVYHDSKEQTLENAEFDLDADHEWNTMLHLKGTCKLNGKGHKITFGPQGGIVVDIGAELLLNNIIINNVWGENIKCENDSGVLKFYNVTWTQTSDYEFNNGKMEIEGDLTIKGPNTRFTYASSQVSTIRADAQLSFHPHVTFYYDIGMINRLAMINETSRLNLNEAKLSAAQNIQLTKGTLVFDNYVDLSVPAGRTIFFGDGINVANNLDFEYHVSSQVNKLGSGLIVNQNV